MFFIYSFFTYSYFWKNRPAFTFHSKCVTHNIELWIELIYLNVYFDCYLFISLIWFILNTGMTFLFWNHSIIAQHVFTSTQSASPRDWVLNCIYVSLFIHSFTYSYFLYYYLFVSLNLIYINQVWHFCFEIVQKYTPIYFHSKCVTAT